MRSGDTIIPTLPPRAKLNNFVALEGKLGQNGDGGGGYGPTCSAADCAALLVANTESARESERANMIFELFFQVFERRKKSNEKSKTKKPKTNKNFFEKKIKSSFYTSIYYMSIEYGFKPFSSCSGFTPAGSVGTSHTCSAVTVL